MINFQPDKCLPKDPAGWGFWLTGHYREHVQMANIASLVSPPFSVPDYDIFKWSDEPGAIQKWLVSHEQIHQVLRSLTNTDGTDLSLVDLSQADEFLEWQDDHALEHQNFRQVLGIS